MDQLRWSFNSILKKSINQFNVYEVSMRQDSLDITIPEFIENVPIPESLQYFKSDFDFVSRDRRRNLYSFSMEGVRCVRRYGGYCRSINIRNRHIRENRMITTSTLDKKIKEMVEKLGPEVMKMKSVVKSVQLEGVIYVRKLLSIEKKPPINSVLHSGCVNDLVKFLNSEDQVVLFETLYAVTNICSGTVEQINKLVEVEGFLDNLVKIINENVCTHEVISQSMWCIGNIAAEEEYRDMFLKMGLLKVVIKTLQVHENASLAKNAVWCLSNLVRGKPVPEYLDSYLCIPTLFELLETHDTDVLVDALWALSYLSDGHEMMLKLICEPTVVLKLIHLLSHHSLAVVTPSLRTIGCLCSGEDEYVDTLLDMGGIAPLLSLLSSNKRSIRKEVMWTLSNISSGTSHQIQNLIDNGVFHTLPKFYLFPVDIDICREAVWCMCNFYSSATKKQINEVCQNGNNIRAIIKVLHCCINPSTNEPWNGSKYIEMKICILEGLLSIVGKDENCQFIKQIVENPKFDCIVKLVKDPTVEVSKGSKLLLAEIKRKMQKEEKNEVVSTQEVEIILNYPKAYKFDERGYIDSNGIMTLLTFGLNKLLKGRNEIENPVEWLGKYLGSPEMKKDYYDIDV